MDWLIDFLNWSNYQIATPQAYGLFHLCFFAGFVLLAILLAVFFKKSKPTTINRVIFCFGIFLLIIEIYKQLLFTYADGNTAYRWYAFPFQFCSVPIYVCLIAPWIKNAKVQNALYAFLGFFGMLAGLIVMIYPGDVFTSALSISLHTMLWHGTMIVIGAILLANKGYGKKNKNYGSAWLVFLSFVVAALALDIGIYNALGFAETGTTFNMFFISPYYTSSLIILHDIQLSYGYFIMLGSYLLAFTIASFLVFTVALVAHKIAAAIKKHADRPIVEKY